MTTTTLLSPFPARRYLLTTLVPVRKSLPQTVTDISSHSRFHSLSRLSLSPNAPPPARTRRLAVRSSLR